MSRAASSPLGPNRMSARAIRALLGRSLIASLATVDAAGKPHLIPIWFRRQGNRLLFPTSSKTKKVRNLRRNQYGVAMVHEARGAMDLLGVMLRGPVEIIDGDEARRLNRSIHLRYVSARELRHPEVAAYLGGDDVTLALTMDEVVSWDMSTMAARVKGS